MKKFIEKNIDIEKKFWQYKENLIKILTILMSDNAVYLHEIVMTYV
jgi:hypothetical protein